jgi:hypothetical protein
MAAAAAVMVVVVVVVVVQFHAAIAHCKMPVPMLN